MTCHSPSIREGHRKTCGTEHDAHLAQVLPDDSERFPTVLCKPFSAILIEIQVIHAQRLQHSIQRNRSKMAYKGQKVQKVMVQPINLIFRYLQNRSRIQIWLYEQVNMRIEGHIIGFDEYMNLVLDDAEEVHLKTKKRRPLGRILLKGDNITLLMNTQPS
ncbi:small nuclear ribonucleoprotein E-like [Acropora millepora]|uniref:small nuclear ribonucleoprotein E-like n=2 Tax=Acropora TaxID=6127 RepID=UPI001CF5CDDC|nr:small nuclear ribonucleoprotein E-like [Acropora millepora]